MLKKHQKEYILILVLLLFSGNPLITFLFGKYATFVLLLIVVILLNKRLTLKRSFLLVTQKVTLLIILISIFQYFQLGVVSVLGMFNLLLKIIIGGYIVFFLGSKFQLLLLKVVFHLSTLSLILFFLINILKISLPHVSIGGHFQSYFFYTLDEGEYINKNFGMFWEPGAHAGILTLCLALNFDNLRKLWNSNRKKIIVIIITLISVKSTTGYLVGFLIIFFYFLSVKNFFIISFVLPLVLGIGFILYQTTDVLQDKIEGQYSSALDQNVGEFSNTRFGSLVFDWYYIKKNPLTGNGLLEETRYADHQFLFKDDEFAVASGNGFSNTLASLGVFFVFGYFYSLWQITRKKSFYYAIVVSSVVIFNLQGEQWFNFPLYLALPFLFFGKKNIPNMLNIKKI